MLRRRSLMAVLVFVVGLIPWRTMAAPAAPAGLARFLSVAGYDFLTVELDGRDIMVTQYGEISSYVAISSAGSHHLKLYGSNSSSVELPMLLADVAQYRVATGSVMTEIVSGRGLETSRVVPPAAPRDRVLFHTEVFGDAPSPVVRFGNASLTAQENLIVPPQTALVELRHPITNQLLDSEYLRAQPGYRYDIIVVGYFGAHDAAYNLEIAPTSPQLAAHPTDTRFFAETGHILEGRIQEYWDATGGLPVFGFPLNDDHLVRTPEGRFVIQVFERNRLEYHSEKQAPYDVLLGRLGDERLRQLGRDWRKEYTVQPIEPACEAMTTDGRQFAVCEPFRSYYRGHGLEFDGGTGFSVAESLALFGLPLTQAKQERNSSGDLVLTQWFERARLEYHPQNPVRFQVLLGRLGAEVYDLQPLTFDDEDRVFKRASKPGAADWQEVEGGFGGHYWWGCAENIGRGELGNLAAQWGGRQLQGVGGGSFDVQVFIPDDHANSRMAPYTLLSGDDFAHGIVVNQKPYSNQWATLARSQFFGMYLHSNTGESGNCTYQIAADAIRLVPKNEP